MSATFTIHLPRDSVRGDPGALERAEFVRDGFSWGAFLVPGLWFLWHRHVVLALVAFAVVLGTAFGLAAFRLPPGAVLLVQFLLHLFFGLEGASLRRLALRLRGRPMTGLVTATDEAEAETKGFARWLEADTPPAAPLAEPLPVRTAAPAIRRREEPVFGLFPDFEGRR